MKKLLLIICLLLSLASTVANAKTYEEEIKEYHEPQTEAELLVDKVLKLEKTLKRDKCGNTKLTAFVFGDYTNLTKEEIALYGTFFTKEYLERMRQSYKHWIACKRNSKWVAKRKLEIEYTKKSAKIDMTKKNYKLWMNYWEQTKCDIERTGLFPIFGCNWMHKIDGFLYNTQDYRSTCKSCLKEVVLMPKKMQGMSLSDANKFMERFADTPRLYRYPIDSLLVEIKDEGNGYKVAGVRCLNSRDRFDIYSRKK